ncbi:hypothetical protein PG993_014911 [Apiospora rasikravindrae]|uniref:Sulfatase-modifying factor enzyme domain-containing protein n=1 Tax=Apiospora rasikravindrae TaxID=990691 RepID=A0ABR1RPE2_9PEZI
MASGPSPYAFPLKVDDYASTPVPSMEEWEILWKAWDLVTAQMIPADALMEQPIPLRNPLKFYVGHIPTFEDIHLARATGTPLTEPASYARFFERGIDPDVDDPRQCHDHSELPTIWPELSEMLEYRENVKRRITLQYDTGRAYSDRSIGRALWIGYEHEGLHLETFLYMAVLSPNIKAPPDIPRPDFAGMARDAASRRVENQWFRIPEQELTIGYEDPESDDGPDRYFAWDNEREPYDIRTSAFEAQARPVSVGEYAAFLIDTGKTDEIPAMWVKLNTCDGETDGVPRGHDVEDTALQAFIAQHGHRTVWGPIPLSQAVDWPATASWNEMTSYSEWKGGGVRFPTLHEVRSIHEHAAQLNEGQLLSTTTTTTSPSHSNPANPSKNKDMHTDPESIFVDLGGANVGLQNFHPVPVTHRGGRLCGLGELGGAWEWTSTVFAPQPQFKPMDIYPVYSEDGLDGREAYWVVVCEAMDVVARASAAAEWAAERHVLLDTAFENMLQQFDNET